MSNSNGAYDEALAGMAGNNPNRQPMGTSALSANVAPASSGTLVPKKNTAAADPTVQAKPSRNKVMQERLGAAYGVSVNYTASTNPEAGLTQANGRIFKPAIMRDRYNFDDGNRTSY